MNKVEMKCNNKNNNNNCLLIAESTARGPITRRPQHREENKKIRMKQRQND